jgi:hypothetical protein
MIFFFILYIKTYQILAMDTITLRIIQFILFRSQNMSMPPQPPGVDKFGDGEDLSDRSRCQVGGGGGGWIGYAISERMQASLRCSCSSITYASNNISDLYDRISFDYANR